VPEGKTNPFAMPHRRAVELHQDRHASGIRVVATRLVAAEHWLRNAAGIKADPGLVLANL
jgi:hypothetical protein